jgi:hypothetical protein
MPVVKSFVTGAVAVIVYVFAVGAIATVSVAPRMQDLPPATLPTGALGAVAGGGWVGGVGAITVPILPLAIGAVLVFAATFYWMFRRTARKSLTV